MLNIVRSIQEILGKEIEILVFNVEINAILQHTAINSKQLYLMIT